ncbi:MAG: MBL fold metallo-hydrolase [Anaerolineales bacterium]|jgi:7,8-dihydropterin-6-yl-methyl-4-(beta-D-ribofuranosyl)aminobenzene 5'-phosphate synthase
MAEITCVVNNTAQQESTLHSEHGLAFWIETGQNKVLLDTGQTAAVLSHNLALLDLAPQDIDALALSHAHYDHTGGLHAVLSENKQLKIFAHTELFLPRYSLKEGKYQSIGLKISREELSSCAELHLSNDPQEIVPSIWTTGEITARPEVEGRSNHHFIRTDKGWQPDPYQDDLSLVLKTSAGLVVICGCCHAGLLNTLFYIEHIFDEPMIAVVGGTHLNTASDAYLSHVIGLIRKRYPDLHLYLNHCTGERAIQAFIRSFGSRAEAFPAGRTIYFDD